MTTKHTPGPWAISEGSFLTNEGQRAIMGKDHEGDTIRVGLVDLQRRDVKRGKAWNADDAERDANARLIAAAPDLLAALEKMLAWAEDPDCDSALPVMQAHAVEAARAAIRKATEALPQ